MVMVIGGRDGMDRGWHATLCWCVSTPGGDVMYIRGTRVSPAPAAARSPSRDVVSCNW